VLATTLISSANISASNLITTVDFTASGQANLGNIVIDGNDVTGTDGVVTFNAAGNDVNFVFSGDTNQSVLVVDAGSDTVIVGGNIPTVGATLKIASTDSLLLPVGNTTQRPGTPDIGMFRFNTSEDVVEVYTSAGWTAVGSEIAAIVSDQFTGNGVQTVFTLSAASTTAATIVSINGVVQIPVTAYAVSSTTLTFTEAPESTDEIDVRILTSALTSITGLTNSPANASISGNATASQFDVTGNLIPAADATYNLGSLGNRWADLFVSGNSIHLGNVVIKNTTGNIIGFFGPDGTTPGFIDTNNIDSASVSNGTSNVAVVAANGNVAVNIGGNLVTTFYGNGISTPGSILIGNVLLKESGGNLRVRTASDNADAVVEATFVATSFTSGNIQIGDNHIESTNTNGEINLRPDGIGNVELESATIKIGKQNANVVVTSFGTGNLVFAVNASNIIAVTAGGIENGLANGVGNIGSETNTFNTVFAKATSAQYADLAEMYTADAAYAPGTVVSFGGAHEVTMSTTSSDNKIAGVISTNPSYIMNSVLQGEHVVAVALTGRVPTQVFGPVRKGDMMVSAGNGHACASSSPAMGTVIGKSLENFDGVQGAIEIVVGRL
jgi:uncharacterized protein YjlB